MSDPLASPADAELRAHLGRILDAQYDLDAELGRGGMGIVYKARDRRLKRAVAIKVLPPELAFRGEIRARFLREAETAAQLSHPNIVPIYAVDEKEGLVYFVMALIEGENLAQRIHARGAMDPDDVRRILREVADALAYAHERHVIHRDIKPDNILLDRSSGRPMVTDFGIARAISEGADARLTATGIAIGTPAYMSPEQSAGDKEVDGRSDLYSLGVVAYQMLTGELPFIASSTPAMLVKHLSERPTPVHVKRGGVPNDLAASVMCLLEKNPADRFAGAMDLVRALDGAGAIPAPRAPAAAPPPWSPVQDAGGLDAFSAQQIARWNARPVAEFRKRLAPFVMVNAVILVISVFTGANIFAPVATIWGIILAFKYAKLWSEGYDWRDVFRQPRERLLFDVFAEWIDDVRALFDREKRAEVRSRWAARSRQPGLLTPPTPAGGTSALGRGGSSGVGSAAAMQALAGSRADLAQRAFHDRDQIVEILASLPKSERKELKDVEETARALAERVHGLAVAIADLDRSGVPTDPGVLDREIAQLESQANPLDRNASEARVRRLASLKRDRRRVGERARRRQDLEAKLESCALALQSLRLDVLRLKTGAGSTSNVTLLAERAMDVARDVEGMIEANRAAQGS